MRKQFLAILGVGAVVLGLAGSLAWAKTAAVVEIPFDFVANDKELPAGRYEMMAESADQNRLAIRNLNGDHTFMLSVLTRLADVGGTNVRVVFDKTEDGKCFLSEVHMPNMDGFALQGAPGRHTHKVVRETTEK